MIYEQTPNIYTIQESKLKLTLGAMTRALFLLLFCHINNQCSLKKLKLRKIQKRKLKIVVNIMMLPSYPHVIFQRLVIFE